MLSTLCHPAFQKCVRSRERERENRGSFQRNRDEQNFGKSVHFRKKLNQWRDFILEEWGEKAEEEIEPQYY